MEKSKLTNIFNDPTFETLQITKMPDSKERVDVVSQRSPIERVLSQTSGPDMEPFLEMETRNTQLPCRKGRQ